MPYPYLVDISPNWEMGFLKSPVALLSGLGHPQPPIRYLYIGDCLEDLIVYKMAYIFFRLSIFFNFLLTIPDWSRESWELGTPLVTNNHNLCPRTFREIRGVRQFLILIIQKVVVLRSGLIDALDLGFASDGNLALPGQCPERCPISRYTQTSNCLFVHWWLYHLK